MLAINQLIQYTDASGQERIERVVLLSRESNAAYLIAVDSDTGFPMRQKISDLLTSIQEGSIKVCDSDPYMKIVDEEKLTSAQKENRDNAWLVIESLLTDEMLLINRHTRGPLVKKIAQQHKLTIDSVYKYLRRYWQRGKSKNALLPDYEKSGGKGKSKTIGSKKLGRPRKYPEIAGEGINLDENLKRIFRLSLDEFYLNKRESRNFSAKEISLYASYKMMIDKYFTDTEYNANGITKGVILPEENLPTFIQYKYLFEKEYDIKKVLIARKGKIAFEKEHRAILHTSTGEVFGPGARYQIDATIADVYLVSRYNRAWIIGRPVIYAVIDVFSRAVVGIYVGLEGPSWIGAAMALANAAANKASFCAEYDITINDTDWPCSGLPEAILGDRGELAGKAVETLGATLNVRIENTAPYRADWKGIVERHFRTIQDRVKPLLPGFILPDFRQRGGHDYRLDAKLDLHQFTQIIIKCVLYHNNSHFLQNYSRDEMMIEEEFETIPVQIWNWGIENRTGVLKWFPDDIVKLNLLPRALARITARGIKFQGMYYSCDRAIKELWFEQARHNGSWSVDVSYDPRNMNSIYLRHDSGRSFDVLRLLDGQEKYKDKRIEEIAYFSEYEKYKYKEYAHEELQAQKDLSSEIDALVNAACLATDNVVDVKQSKVSRIKGIQGNRKIEREMQRQEEAFQLGRQPVGSGTETAPEFVEQVKPDGNPNFLSDLELLKKKQKEKLHGKHK
ncbi:MAG: Integrase catalytic region [Firmicutes bacterium]|nr:Integrase catalytic region [Bacillota bacterium]